LNQTSPINTFQSEIISYYPTNNLSTTTPTFASVSYVVRDDGNENQGKISTYLINQDTGENTFLPFENTLKNPGFYTSTTTLALTAGRYTWSKQIVDSNDLQKGIGNISYFTIGTSVFNNNYSTSTPFGELVGNTFGNSTTTSETNLLGFLNVPELMKNKLPFAYIFQIQGIITNAINGNSSNAIGKGTITFKLLPGIATTTIDMFSSSTIQYFLTPTYVNLFRSLEVYILWFTLMWFLHHDAKNKHLF